MSYRNEELSTNYINAPEQLPTEPSPEEPHWYDKTWAKMAIGGVGGAGIAVLGMWIWAQTHPDFDYSGWSDPGESSWPPRDMSGYIVSAAAKARKFGFRPPGNLILIAGLLGAGGVYMYDKYKKGKLGEINV